MSLFITLTYRNENLPNNSSLSKRDLQLFFKRLRKFKGKFRYFASGEYGENYGRPHYHAILFGIALTEAELDYVWGKGRVQVGTLTEQSARYCAKYIQKQLFGEDRKLYKDMEKEREFSCMSRRPGIGHVYAEKFKEVWRAHGFISLNGQKRPIPRYYKGHYTALEKDSYNSMMAERRYELFAQQTQIQSEIWKLMKGDDEKARQQILDKAKLIDMYTSKKF